MEKYINIKTPDGKVIYGMLRGPLNDTLAIFVHGFTGNRNEHYFFNGARFFEKNGLSSYRFNLYDDYKDARKLEECTLSLHANDLDTVIRYFRNKGVKKIFVVGHSFGGVTVLLSKDKDFDKAVLWDSSVLPGELSAKGVYLKQLDLYYINDWAYGFTFGKGMYEENKGLKSAELIKDIHVPIKIIVAGNGELVEGGKELFKNANDPKEFYIVKGATHTFFENGTEEDLLRATLDWFKKD